MARKKNESVGIATLRKIDSKLTIDKVIVLVTGCVERVNVGRSMSARQIVYCSEDIVNSEELQILNLSLDELYICLQRGARGEYGIIYDKMDGSVIFSWVWKYLGEKKQIWDRDDQKEFSEFKAERNELTQHPQIAESYKLVLSKLDIKERENIPKYDPEKRMDVQKLDDEFSQEFNELWIEQGQKEVNKFRIIEYKGSTLMEREYLDTRHNENK